MQEYKCLTGNLEPTTVSSACESCPTREGMGFYHRVCHFKSRRLQAGLDLDMGAGHMLRLNMLEICTALHSRMNKQMSEWSLAQRPVAI